MKVDNSKRNVIQNDKILSRANFRNHKQVPIHLNLTRHTKKHEDMMPFPGDNNISQEVNQLLKEISKLEDWAYSNTEFKHALQKEGMLSKLKMLKQEFVYMYQCL